MDSTPPSHTSNPKSRPKSESRLSRIKYSIQGEEPPNLSLDLIPSSLPKKTPSTPSTLALKSSTNSLPLQEHLLSPSPSRKSRTHLADRLEMAEEASAETTASRRRCKGKGTQLGALGCASPRNSRRLRRRSEMEVREERDLMMGLVEEIGKVRKRRHSNRSKKEKLSLVPFLPSSSSSPNIDDGVGGDLDKIGTIFYDLIMWKDAAKSSLWFGLGCLCFFSSCFAKGVNFSIFSVGSQLGLLFLCASFFSNSICQSNTAAKRHTFKLKEEDLLRVGRLVLPAANLAISKTRELFSGEPSMTLKVTPFLLIGAKYGHLLTLWRLCALGFFISFTIPKLYACYSNQMNRKVERTRCWFLEAWKACSHKKIVAASGVTAFWNLSSLKTRIIAEAFIFSAFICLVILRCGWQHLLPKEEEREAEDGGEQEPQQALVVVAGVPSQK